MESPKIRSSKKGEGQILENQKEHANKLIKILEKSHLAVDTSSLGSGKTYVLNYIAKYYKLPVLVFCPLSAVPTWKAVTKLFGNEVLGIHNYEMLTRSKEGKQDWLLKFKVLNKTEFGPSDKLLKEIESGLLAVFDEYQVLKNKSSLQTQACSMISKSILSGKSGKSRFMMLTGSAIDKVEQVEQFLRFSGYLTKRMLYYYDVQNHVYISSGMAEVQKVAKDLNPEGFAKFMREHVAPTPAEKMSKKIREYLDTLLNDIILPKIRSSMTPDTVGDPFYNDVDIANGFYQLNEISKEELREAIRQIAVAIDYDEETGNIKTSFGSLGLITKQLEIAEFSKREIFVRRAREILNKNKNAKVVIFVNYLKTIEYLKKALIEYNPILLTGEVKGDTRAEGIELFQEFNNKRRLIIATLGVASVSISLHDLDGGFPRTALISPSFSAMKIHQATGRIRRQGMKSKAVIRIIYVYGLEIEQRIQQRLTEKGEVMERFHGDQGSVFPNSYAGEYEDVTGTLSYRPTVTRTEIPVDDLDEDEIVNEDEEE